MDRCATSTANFRTIRGAQRARHPHRRDRRDDQRRAAGTYELVHYTGPGATARGGDDRQSGRQQPRRHLRPAVHELAANGSTATRPSYRLGRQPGAQNITLKNTAVRSVLSQAEALLRERLRFHDRRRQAPLFQQRDLIGPPVAAGSTLLHRRQRRLHLGTSDVTLIEAAACTFSNISGGAATYNMFVARTGATIAAGANGRSARATWLSIPRPPRRQRHGPLRPQRGRHRIPRPGRAGQRHVPGAGDRRRPLDDHDRTAVARRCSYVGWKSAGCTGLNLATATTAGTSAVSPARHRVRRAARS